MRNKFPCITQRYYIIVKISQFKIWWSETKNMLLGPQKEKRMRWDGNLSTLYIRHHFSVVCGENRVKINCQFHVHREKIFVINFSCELIYSRHYISGIITYIVFETGVNIFSRVIITIHSLRFFNKITAVSIININFSFTTNDDNNPSVDTFYCFVVFFIPRPIQLISFSPSSFPSAQYATFFNHRTNIKRLGWYWLTNESGHSMTNGDGDVLMLSI